MGGCGERACGVQDALKEQTSKVEQLSKTKEELSASEAKSRKLAEELEKKVGELHQKMEDSSAATEEVGSDQRARCQSCRVSSRVLAP